MENLIADYCTFQYRKESFTSTEGGARTHTLRRELDFESSASTSFTTSAYNKLMYQYTESIIIYKIRLFFYYFIYNDYSYK